MAPAKTRRDTGNRKKKKGLKKEKSDARCLSTWITIVIYLIKAGLFPVNQWLSRPSFAVVKTPE